MYLQAASEEEGVAMTRILATELMELTGLGLIGVRLPDGGITDFGGTAGTLGAAALS